MKYRRRVLKAKLHIPDWHEGMTVAEYVRKFDTANALKSVKYHGH